MNGMRWGTVINSVVSLLAASTLLARTSNAAPVQPAGIQAALVGTIFSYQGQLKKGGNAHNGVCNFQFSLWDAATAGAQLGSTLVANNVSVFNGLFAVPLDFGDQFSGDARWVQTAVQCAGDAGFTPLLPRTALNATPYALSLRPGATISTTAQNTPALKVNALAGNANGLVAYGNGNGFAVVYGEDQSASGGYGIFGKSTKGQGVYGVSASQSGVVGVSTKASGVSGSSVNWYGIDGVTTSTDYAGVRGTTLSTGLLSAGVYGVSPNGQGVKGISPAGQGVKGESEDGLGVWGVSTASYGVMGQSSAAFASGVLGMNNTSNGIGVRGSAGATGSVGVWGESSANTGVYGVSTYGNGVWGQSTNGFAMYASGNAAQALNAGGWAKAMVYVDPAWPAGKQVLRCYNSQLPAAEASVAPCGITASGKNLGIWLVDFGFDISSRFVALTIHTSTGGCLQCGMEVGQIGPISAGATGAEVVIQYSYPANQYTNAPFTIIIY